MEAVEDWTRDDPSGDVRRPEDRLLLGDRLMWPGLVVEDDELGEKAAEVLHVEEEDVVEQLAAERANESLGEGVHVRRAHGGADDTGAGALESGRESGAELRVAVGDQHLGLLVHRGVAGLLGAPVVGGRRGRRDVNDAAAPEVEEEEHENGAEERIARLNEVAAPRDVIGDEGAPGLAVVGSASGP